MAPLEPVKGALVEIPAGRGVVRFIGATQFSPGKWIGIELSEPKGKNDGSVMGVAYFSCKMNHGVFVRPSQVKVLELLPVDMTPARPQATARLSHQRQSSTSLSSTPVTTRAPSARSIPSNSSRSTSPAKPAAPATPRPSLVASRFASASPTKRSSLPHTSNPIISSPSLPTPRRTLTVKETPQEVLVQSPVNNDPPIVRIPSPPIKSSPSVPSQDSPHTNSVREPFSILVEDGDIQASPIEPVSPILRPPSSSRVREEQELRARLRITEARREEDARRIRELETRLADAEGFVSIRPKLQAKLNTLQTELINARRAQSEAESLSSMSETRLMESNEQLEMAMLDKEIAEERAEIAETELEGVKERLAMVEVELNALKGGLTEDGSDLPDSAKERLSYIRLEKQNERLKEALIKFAGSLLLCRLRDISAETEVDQRRKIIELERELANTDELQADYENNLKDLLTAEKQIEDLKERLDDALGAEDILEALTNRNMELGEKIEEMRLSIEDLEMLKELADELEEQHIETEKALQEDLDAKDMEIHEHSKKITELNTSLEDYEHTITQFRDLVLQLQSELDTLRAETQTAQNESATQASKASHIMSMNIKLQSSMSKNQARNIDLELRKIEAREARELLSIIQPFLPQTYIETDSDSTSCYLFFQRMAFKADLINSVVAQTHNLPDSLNGPVSESLVGVCEMRGRISHLSTLSKRFAAILRRCDVESFLNFGRLYPEIAPVEKRIDMHIDLLKREEFRELECVSDVSKMLAQFEHLAESYFSGFEFDLGERELDHALALDNDLDMFSAAVGLTKTAIQVIQKDDEISVDVIVEWGQSDTTLMEPMQRLLDQCRAAKQVSMKLVKRIQDILKESSAFSPLLLPQLSGLTVLVSKAVDFAIQLAQSVNGYLADVRAAKHPFQLGGVLTIVREIATATMSRREAAVPSWEDVSASLLQLIKDASDILPAVMENENVIKITGIAPWIHRIEEVKASLAVNIEAERKVTQLNEEMQDLVRGLKVKDQVIQESSVKIELMERRMEAVKKQADTITDLENELVKARKQERAYEEAMEQLQADLDTLEQDNLKLKTMASGMERQGLIKHVNMFGKEILLILQVAVINAPPQNDAEPVIVEGNLETSHLLEQIEALRGAVRFLRNENSYLKGYDLLKDIQSLPPIDRVPTPQLDYSQTPSDSDESDYEQRPMNLRTLATETKVLYRDVIKFSSSRRVIDLSALNKQRIEQGRKWMPKKQTPAQQVWEKKVEAEELGRRVKMLLEKARVI
ncbi:hypothetical protein Clacol_002649 [Clathrus columnatus]|uniref:CAP-Gly domain-containing protein n=1 Tax=Clathrus columnatus TaxID=1419009 RepID=A0AAV5A4N5_9AGAM|nr:hypothetical protein Clacol_002649 [Clathrus columnatus]